MKRINNPILLILGLFLAFSCAKKRPPRLLQGHGKDNLFKVSDYDGKKFNVKTNEVMFKNASKSAVSIQAESNNCGASATSNDSFFSKRLDFVAYSSEHKLYKEYPLKGCENTTYTMQFNVEENFLVISKVVSKGQLSFEEKTYAEEIADGKYRVRQVGYPITGFYHIVNRKNSNNEDTQDLIEESLVAGDPRITHFKISTTAATQFDAAKKDLIFPKEYFKGDWFIAVTTLDTSVRAGGMKGIQDSSTGNLGSRIEFNLKNNTLHINTKNDLAKSSDVQLEKSELFSIPVNPVDFTITSIGSSKGMKEERVDDDHSEANQVSERKYVELDLSGLSHNIHLYPKSVSMSNGEVESVKLTRDYLEFILKDSSGNVRVMYSIARAHKPKYNQSRNYPIKDMKKFGYFFTFKKYKTYTSYFRRDELDGNLLVNRFMPGKDGTIKFYPSNLTPKEYYPVISEVFKEYQAAFYKFSNVKVVFDTSMIANLGDVRYNTVNFIDIDHLSGGGLLGYGPSVQDSETGESVSATSNIYVQNFRDILRSHVRDHILRKTLGLPSASRLSTPGNAPQNFADKFSSEQDMSNVMGLADPFKLALKESGVNPLFPSKHAKETVFQKYAKIVKQANGVNTSLLTKKSDEFASMSNVANKVIDSNTMTLNHEKFNQEFNQFTNLHKFCNHQSTPQFHDTKRAVNNKCGQKLESYIAALTEARKDDKSIYTLPNESEVVDSCVALLLPETLKHTLLHELGHNFGLMHNFTASNDVKNFRDKEENLSSSIMDYVPISFRSEPVLGKYDIAALQYGYKSEILSEDENKVIKLDPLLSIEENLATKNSGLSENAQLKARTYKYCNDYDVYYNISPLCKRHDVGRNIEEITEYYIDQGQRVLEMKFKRFDKLFGPSWMNANLSLLYYSYLPLLDIYLDWRDKSTRILGKENMYFDSVTIPYLNTVTGTDEAVEATSKEIEPGLRLNFDGLVDSEKFIGKLKNDPELASYYRASIKIQQFMTDILKKNTKSCIVSTKTNSSEVVDFRKLKNKAWDKYGASFSSCYDPLMKDLVDDYIGTLKETGSPFNDLFDTNDIQTRTMEEVGLFWARQIAGIISTYRFPVYTTKGEYFFPSMVDEPHTRSNVQNYLVPRVAIGESFDILKFGTMGIYNSVEYKLTFHEEINFLKSLPYSYLQGLIVPNNRPATVKRLKKFFAERDSANRTLLNIINGREEESSSTTINSIQEDKYSPKFSAEEMSIPGMMITSLNHIITASAYKNKEKPSNVLSGAIDDLKKAGFVPKTLAELKELSVDELKKYFQSIYIGIEKIGGKNIEVNEETGELSMLASDSGAQTVQDLAIKKQNVFKVELLKKFFRGELLILNTLNQFKGSNEQLIANLHQQKVQIGLRLLAYEKYNGKFKESDEAAAAEFKEKVLAKRAEILAEDAQPISDAKGIQTEEEEQSDEDEQIVVVAEADEGSIPPTDEEIEELHKELQKLQEIIIDLQMQPRTAFNKDVLNSISSDNYEDRIQKTAESFDQSWLYYVDNEEELNAQRDILEETLSFMDRVSWIVKYYM